MSDKQATPTSFIQWKGTDVCIELYCTCGAHHHFDGFFLYAWKCGKCGACWEMETHVGMKPCGPGHDCIKELNEDD